MKQPEMKMGGRIVQAGTGLLKHCLLALVLACPCYGESVPIKESSFGKSLVPGKFILPAKDGWWNWGMAPIYDEKGKLHIFNSSIPYKGEKSMGYWQSKSTIIHYVADSIEGPFELLGTVFSSDQRTYHNPQISKVGDTYVLVFLWKSVEPGSLQSIGIATAKSLDGPWTENPNNPIIRPTPGKPNSAHASNPSFLVDRDGKFRIYYKSMSVGSKFREISMAIADKIDGPYVDCPNNPLISYKDLGRDIEDPYAFFYQDSYYMIVEDRMDVAGALSGSSAPKPRPGGNRPGLIYQSKDGITWERPEISYNTDAQYFGTELSRTERPHILWKDGKPEYLFLANHASREAGFYLKIEGWDPASPDARPAGSSGRQRAKSSQPGAVIEPTWESMAAHYDVPDWFVDGKLGVWFHWGIPSAADENRPNDGSHYGRRMYSVVPDDYKGEMGMSETLTKWHTERYGHPSEFGYEDLIPLFKAEKWDPDALVKYVRNMGARFIMPVACHHDNFDMYDSFHPWNAVKMGPKRDTLREWKAAAAKHGLKFGVSTHLYWSPRFFANARKYQKPGTPEWSLFNMDYDQRGYATQDSWNEHWYARCWDIIEKYDPDMFNNDSPYPKIKGGKGLGIKLFTDFLNRDLKENDGKQSVVLSFKDGNANREAFTYNLERGSSGVIQPEPWMWATDLSGGWFYRATAVNRMSIPVMIGNSIDAISKNGVVMLNVALKGDGTIPKNQAAYLEAFGEVYRTNAEGIYGSRPWKVYGEGPLEIKTGRQGENKKDYSQEDIRFTTKDGVLYAFVLAPPTKDIVIKTLRDGGPLEEEISKVTMLGSDEIIRWNRTDEGLTIKLPGTVPVRPVLGFRIAGK